MSSSVSVVIPSYNGERHIEEVIQSIWLQTKRPSEILIVDDCSTDSTVSIVHNLARHAPIPLRLITLELNSGGPARPLNVGIATAESELVAICEQDDRMLPHKLELLAACMARAPNSGMVISRYHVLRHTILDRPSAVQDDSYSRFEGIPKEGLGEPFYVIYPEDAYQTALNRNYAVSFSNMLVNKIAWQNTGGLIENINTVCDHAFLLQISRSYKVGFVDKVLWEFHRYSTGLLEKNRESAAQEDYKRIWLREYRTVSAPDLRTNLRKKLRENLLGQAYYCRQEGQHIRSLNCYISSILYTGLSCHSMLGLVKLLSHYVVTRNRNKKRE